jgi:hypothetical protein
MPSFLWESPNWERCHWHQRPWKRVEIEELRETGLQISQMKRFQNPLLFKRYGMFSERDHAIERTDLIALHF